MKRFFPVLLIAVVVLGLLAAGAVSLLSLLFAPQDAVLASLPDYESKEYYTSGGFQDFTDYAKYTYSISETPLTHNPYFRSVDDEDIPQILSYIGNFEGWVDICQDFPKAKYDFDASMVEAGDYFYILNEYEDQEKKFWNYDLYYFDLDTGILYFFHSNI